MLEDGGQDLDQHKTEEEDAMALSSRPPRPPGSCLVV
jgi:hypothetical protein